VAPGGLTKVSGTNFAELVKNPGFAKVVELSRPGCPPCAEAAGPGGLLSQLVSMYKGKVRILSGSAGTDSALRGYTKPTAYPTYVVYNKDGEEVGRVTGNNLAAIQKAVKLAQRS
jgi:hypothetical protein